MGQIGPKQPIFKVETRDIGLLYVFENTHHYQCIHKIICAYTSENLGQVDQNWVNCWAKIEPNWPKRAQLDRSTYFDGRDLPLGSRHSFDCYDHPQGISEVTLPASRWTIWGCTGLQYRPEILALSQSF